MEENKKESALKEAKGHLDAIATGFKYLVDPHRITLDYPAEAIELPKNYRGFFKLQDDKCIGCSLCEMICPSNAIVMTQLPPPPLKSSSQAGTPSPSPAALRPKKRPVIDWGLCIFCYFCVDVCPTEAFETSNIHDLSYFQEGEYRPTFNGFLSLPNSPSGDAKKVVAKTDLKKGIKYEKSDKK